jgi:hypothetical protein
MEYITMGAGNFDAKQYEVQAKVAQATKNSGFTAKSINDEFRPDKVSMRFSKRGPFNEFRQVMTVIVALDVTGSMGQIPKNLLTGDLGKLMDNVKSICNRPDENVQLSFAAIGDVKSDKAPLQVTHFESDNRFVEQLQKIFLEGGGGPLREESYNLIWWYAANKTHLNYVERDKRKGILITMGDENVYTSLTASDIKKCLDPHYDGGEISNEVLLKAVREQYEVYHLLITDGSGYIPEVSKNWKSLLGRDFVIEIKSQSVAAEISKLIQKHRPAMQNEISNLTPEEWSKKNKENLTDEQWQEVLSYTLCPLTGEYMKNPRELGNSKRVYEKEAIEDYLKKQKQDPMTQEKLAPAEQLLKPNLNIAQLCSNYRSYFEALPTERKERLVKTVLDEKRAVFVTQSKKNEGAEKNNFDFFSQKESASHNSAQAIKEKNIQLSLECPIGGELMTDPVSLVTGHTFERKNIEKWFKDHDTNPATGEKIKDKTLTPNLLVKSLCEEMRSSSKLESKLEF